MKVYFLIYVICASSILQIHQESNTKNKIKTLKGSNISIKLEESIAEGYSWKLIEISDTTLIKYIGRYEVENTSELDGIPRIIEFKFHSLKKGKCILKFMHSQPWQKEKSPKLKYKIYQITIN